MWSDLNLWTSKYVAHEGCQLWLPYQKELKMKSLIGWDIQQVDKRLFNRIGHLSTTTGTTYIHMNQSATGYHTALFLQLCVQWTLKSTGMLHYLYSLIIYLKSHYGSLGCDMCQCRWIQVSQRNIWTASSGLKWKGMMWSGYMAMWQWRCWMRPIGGLWNLWKHEWLKPQSKN